MTAGPQALRRCLQTFGPAGCPRTLCHAFVYDMSSRHVLASITVRCTRIRHSGGFLPKASLRGGAKAHCLPQPFLRGASPSEPPREVLKLRRGRRRRLHRVRGFHRQPVRGRDPKPGAKPPQIGDLEEGEAQGPNTQVRELLTLQFNLTRRHSPWLLVLSPV